MIGKLNLGDFPVGNRMTWRKAILCCAAVAGVALPTTAQPVGFPVTIVVDARQTGAKVEPVWRFFGADEPNYATMKDGRSTLATLGSLFPDHVYFRTHNMLTSGDGTPALKWGSTNIYTEDAKGRPIYDWSIVDRIFDTYRERGVKPYVELGFMPEALSVNPEPYQHAFRPGSGDIKTGWAYPPKDYGKWEELIYQWVTHCVARYGRGEVASWYFETWNEANLTSAYWGGSREEFFHLHDTAIRGVRRALPEARVGGPDIAGMDDDYLSAFMQHVTSAGTPTDFISFHAKGSPSFAGEGSTGHVRMGIANHLQVADRHFAQIAANAAFRHTPVIIGESDPEGCAACQGPANAYRNGTMYSSYIAASFPRLEALAARRQVQLEGLLSWAFEYEDQPYFAGFRQLTSAGIDLPALNMFKLLARVRGRSIGDRSDHQRPLDDVLENGVRGEPDVGSVAALDGRHVSVLVWHYHDDDVVGPDAIVHLDLRHLPSDFRKGVRVTHYRIDKDHSNSYTAWLAMGSPIAPTPAQRAELLRAATLAKVDETAADLPLRQGAGRLVFRLPRQGVSLVEFDAL